MENINYNKHDPGISGCSTVALTTTGPTKSDEETAETNSEVTVSLKSRHDFDQIM